MCSEVQYRVPGNGTNGTENERAVSLDVQLSITVYVNKMTAFHLYIEYTVADPVCFSWIQIFAHSGSRISDPVSNNSNKEEGKKLFALPFCSHKFHKIVKKIYLRSLNRDRRN